MRSTNSGFFKITSVHRDDLAEAGYDASKALLQKAGWDDSPHMINEQRTFTDGRLIFVGGKARRGKQKRADYILRYTADYPRLRPFRRRRLSNSFRQVSCQCGKPR
jgi:hypothetical protein